jgi:hypothetical protein
VNSFWTVFCGFPSSALSVHLLLCSVPILVCVICGLSCCLSSFLVCVCLLHLSTHYRNWLISFNSLWDLNSLCIVSSLCNTWLAQWKAPSVQLLRSPILGCHTTIWYCWRTERICGSVFHFPLPSSNGSQPEHVTNNDGVGTSHCMEMNSRIVNIITWKGYGRKQLCSNLLYC